MKRANLVVGLLCFSVAEVVGQGMPLGAESAALGGACVVLENPWSFAGNPAGLAGFEHLTLNTSLQQNYLLKETGNYALASTIPVGEGTIGLMGYYRGFASFSSWTVGIAFGMNLGEKFQAGAGLYYFFQKTGREYTALHQVSYSIGMAYDLSEKFRLGFTAFNPLNLYYKSESWARLPAVFRLGACYRPVENFELLAEIIKDLDYPIEFTLGCQCDVQDKLIFRGGITLFPARFSLGAGIRLKDLLVDIAAAYHEYLGFSPTTSLQYRFK